MAEPAGLLCSSISYAVQCDRTLVPGTNERKRIAVRMPLDCCPRAEYSFVGFASITSPALLREPY